MGLFPKNEACFLPLDLFSYFHYKQRSLMSRYLGGLSGYLVAYAQRKGVCKAMAVKRVFYSRFAYQCALPVGKYRKISIIARYFRSAVMQKIHTFAISVKFSADSAPYKII